jgi:hypothetical protein
MTFNPNPELLLKATEAYETAGKTDDPVLFTAAAIAGAIYQIASGTASPHFFKTASVVPLQPHAINTEQEQAARMIGEALSALGVTMGIPVPETRHPDELNAFPL